MVCTGSKQSIEILKSEYFQNMTLKMTWVVIQNSQLWSHLYQIFGTSFFWQGRVNGKFWDRPVHCVYVFTKLVIKCSFLKQSMPTSTVWNFLRSKPSYNNVLGTSSLLLLKILCWLCGNHWLCRNCWFRLCRNLRVGAAGLPKYSTPWLLWTPINL